MSCESVLPNLRFVFRNDVSCVSNLSCGCFEIISLDLRPYRVGLSDTSWLVEGLVVWSTVAVLSRALTSLGCKVAGTWSWPLTSICYQSEECMIYTGTSPYTFMAWCLVKQRDGIMLCYFGCVCHHAKWSRVVFEEWEGNQKRWTATGRMCRRNFRRWL